MNSPSADDLIDFINKILSRKKEKRLGDKDINQIISHPWLKDIDWDNMESKMLLKENIPFSPSSGDNFNFLKVNNHINKKDKNYKSYLKLINNSTFFSSFYYNYYTKSTKNSEESNDKNNIYDNCPNDRSNSSKINNKLKSNEKIKKEKDENNCTSEFILSEYEYDFNEEEEVVFNRFSDNVGRLSDLDDDNKIKRYSYSPEKNK
jgi:hypothetical protein